MYHLFDQLVELAPHEIRLDCAALHFARDRYPYLDFAGCLEKLDEMAHYVGDCRPGLSAPGRYQALREVLFNCYQLRGNREDYYDPANAYLNRVLDRRVGIPVSLAAVWVEVARRLKWPVAAVGFPGHVLLRIDDPERFVLVDPFTDGQTLTITDCRELLRNLYDGKVSFSYKYFEPLDTRTLLTRMLENLRGVYRHRRAWCRLELVLERLVALHPLKLEYRQELAAIHVHRGKIKDAYDGLAAILAASDSPDDPQVRAYLSRVEAALSALN